jgi:hypothetical protein
MSEAAMRLPLAVENHAVGATRAFQEQRHLAGPGVPSVNPVVRLVREEYVSMPIRRGALGETESVSQADELSLRTSRHQPSGS